MRRVFIVTFVFIALLVLPAFAAANSNPSDLPPQPEPTVPGTVTPPGTVPPGTIPPTVTPIPPIAPILPRQYLPIIKLRYPEATRVYIYIEGCDGPIVGTNVTLRYEPSGKTITGQTNVNGDYFGAGPASETVIYITPTGQELTMVVSASGTAGLSKNTCH